MGSCYSGRDFYKIMDFDMIRLVYDVCISVLHLLDDSEIGSSYCMAILILFINSKKNDKGESKSQSIREFRHLSIGIDRPGYGTCNTWPVVSRGLVFRGVIWHVFEIEHKSTIITLSLSCVRRMRLQNLRP